MNPHFARASSNILVRIFKLMSRNILRSVNSHSSKLKDVEMCLMDTNTFLLEEDRSFGVKLNSNDKNQE